MDKAAVLLRTVHAIRILRLQVPFRWRIAKARLAALLHRANNAPTPSTRASGNGSQPLTGGFSVRLFWKRDCYRSGSAE
jgi:hypothetical protein